MIDKMALLCSSIPMFNALSDYLTDLENSLNNHCIKRTAIDTLLSMICLGAGDLVSTVIQLSTNTLEQFCRLRAWPPACRPLISVLDALEFPYPDSMRLFVSLGNLKHHLQITHQGQPPPPASDQHCHTPLQIVYSLRQYATAVTPEPHGCILPICTRCISRGNQLR